MQPSTVLLALLGLAWAAPPAHAQRERTFEALLSRVDKNLDGRIGADEVPRRRRALWRLDRNGDGFVDRDEFERRGGDEPEPAPAPTVQAPTPDELAFFESRIRPVLVRSCASCHGEGERAPKGGLRVDSLAALLRGGVSGPAIVPGDPDASPFIEAVRYEDPLFAMPPDEKLSDDVVKDFERWVAMGAPWPNESAADEVPIDDEGEIDWEAAREHWSFHPPKAHAAPKQADDEWSWTDVDRFLFDAMQEAGVAPVADADRATWLRRVTFDLTGLPPTPDEIDAFLADEKGGAFERVVDRLLDTRAFGERWGRHWLDVARYAESSGRDNDIAYPHAWRYRDWVVDAVAADLPYDEFLRRQLAGDLLPVEDETERAWNQIATGYLALGSKNHNARDPRQFQLDVADEQIDAVSQGMLGMTISCARCHDHKFDPIPIDDYYSFAGIFLSTDTRYGTMRGAGNNRPGELIELPARADVPHGPTMDPLLRASTERTREGLERRAERDRRAASAETPEARRAAALAERRLNEAQKILDDIASRFDDEGRALPSNRLAMGALEGEPRDVAVLDRGELDRPRQVAPRGFPRILGAEAVRPIEVGAIEKGSGRLELADWVTNETNPLTARVWVNRVWSHLFGTGLVRTPDNFGASGLAPDHPELLDRLAVDFMDGGWSTKALVRELVLSRAYRLASDHDAQHAALDPEALTRWRMPDRRLEAEAIRDAMYFVSGELEHTPPVGSPVGATEGSLARGGLSDLLSREQPVRSVYLPVVRGNVVDSLDVFDVADPSFVTGDRDETTVATQALYLMNDEGVLRRADAFAARLLAEDLTDARRIDLAFRLAFGRDPSRAESSAVKSFLRDFERHAPEGEPEQRSSRSEERRRERRNRARRDLGLEAELPSLDPRHAAWSAFCQTLFLSAEFRVLG